jgi:hypothetical protein
MEKKQRFKIIHRKRSIIVDIFRGRRGCERMVVAILQLPMQSMPNTTDVVSSNPAHDEVYSIQHGVIKFVNDLR